MVITSAELVNGRYRLVQQIGKGGMGVVYEALDRLTGGKIALKRVAVAGDEPVTGSETAAVPVDMEVLTLHLAREFQMLSSLRHPHIISVLDYGVERTSETDEPRLYYTMELLPNARTILVAGLATTLVERIRLLVELLEAMAYLHRRGILHCDLKPENILVSASGSVKVVDFGLSSLRGTVEPSETGQVAGTLAYMSPELLRGQPATEASDLYAVGMIAYQLLTGEYPFDKSTAAKLMRDILGTEPDLSPLYWLDLPAPAESESTVAQGQLILSETPTLPAIVRRLLAKKPEERYASPNEVITDLVAAGLPIQPESQDVRDSFLQAAQFVGREGELERLRAALEWMLDGVGGAFLVGGESGIGKSRLLNELRTYALISGAQVLTGQAVEGGGLVYQAWREPLRRLVLTTPLTDQQAGILKDLIPDIAALLERPIPDVPTLDSRAAGQRLVRTIIEVFQRQTTPTVLFLEDLHWARENLQILRAVLPLTREQPLLVIGSYRIDEAVELAAELPEMETMLLERLSAAEIDNLSASMLGTNAAPGFSAMLRQESEGNVLFIVEVVRALAEEAGTLDRVSTQAHPFRVVSGGIQAVLRRRLGHIVADARSLLEAAAVAGRVIEPNVLELMCEQHPLLRPQGGVSSWLITCTNAAVLEIFDEQWRFAHDKLREVLMIDLMERGDLPLFSEIVATAVESAYPEAAARASRAAVLADHWRNAGDTEREANALEMAAQVALDKALYEQTLEFIARARNLTKAGDARLARLMVVSTEAYYNLGGLDKSRESAMRALELFGYSIRTDRAKQRQVLPVQLVDLFWQQLRPKFSRSAKNDVRGLYALRVLERLTMIHYFRNERTEIDYFSLYSANVAEQVISADRAERVRGYTTAAVALGSSRRYLASYFIRLADGAMKNVNDVNAITWENLGTSIVSAMYAHWDEVEKRATRCIELARATGNIRRILEGYVTLTGGYYYQSRWDDAKRVNSEMQALAEQYGDIQANGWSFDNLGRFALREGRLDEARGFFELGYDIYTNIVHDTINSIWCSGSIAKAYLCEGNLEAARPYVEKVTRGLLDVRQTSFGMTEPFGAAAEYYLTLWERDGVDSPHAVEARACMAALKQYADKFALALPRYHAYLGWQRRLEGNPRAAFRIGARAVSEGARLKMPYDEAISSIELARHYPKRDPRREAALRRAIDILMPIGAAADLGRAQRLLHNPDES